MADRDNAVERLHKMLSNNSLDLERLQKTLDSCLQQLDLQKGETIINSYYSGMTAVHLAAKNDSHDCLVYLLWRGGNPNTISSADHLSQTPLHFAASKGSPRCIKALLDHGGCIDIKNTREETPLNLVKGKVDCEKVFQQAISTTLHRFADTGQEPEKSLEEFKKWYEHLSLDHTDLATRWTDIHNCTLLYRATKNGFLEIVEYMLSKSKNQPLHNLDTDETPLLIACRKSLHDIAAVLLKHSPKLVFVSEARNKLSPLHVACSRGDVKMVKLILQAIKRFSEEFDASNSNVVSLDFRDKLGCTPLYSACNLKLLDIVKLLVEFQRENSTRVSFNINATVRESERTPLHAAVQNGCLDTVKLLLTVKDIDINVEGRPSKETQSKLIQNYSLGGPILENSMNMKENLQIHEHPKTGMLEFQERGTGMSNGKDFDLLFMSPLAEACACYHTDIMKVLLLQGARDDKGLACRIAHLIKRADLVRLILSFHTVLKENLQMGGGNLGIPHLELNWSHLKLQHCEGEWLGAKAEFYPLCDDLQDSALAENSYILVSELGNPLCTSPEVTVQFDAVRVVHLDNNQLLSVPIELFQLQNVRKINLSHNRLNQLPTYQERLLESTNIHGWACPCLVELMLSYNELTHLPASVWGLPNITKLLCSKNRLETLLSEEGTISKEIILSRTLKDVDISSNSLKGEVSQFLFELPSLRTLDLSGNMIAELPNILWRNSTLQELNVSSNELTSLFQSDQKYSQRSGCHKRRGSYPVPMQQKVLVGKTAVKLGTKVPIARQNTLSTIQPLNTGLGVSVSITAEHFNYSSLHKLNLSENRFSSFPEALACFAPNVTNLNVSRNPLKDLDVQFLPPLLKKLTANNCEIKRLGNTISKKHQVQITKNCQHSSSMELVCLHRSHTHLPYLTTIDLSMNKLTHIQLTRQNPTDDKNINFGRMETEYNHKIVPAMDLLYPSLQNLYLTGNCLEGKFNPNIGHQYNLKAIRLSSNEPLTDIPMEFSYLNRKHFTEFKIEDLPNLRDPPPSYQKAGINHLLTYMRSRVKESTIYRCIKLFFIGNGERGKTTLLRRLKSMAEDKHVECTAGIDIESWVYPDPKKRREKRDPVHFLAWDFAGQEVYHTTHQCFYSKRSMYLALFRLTDGEEGIEELEQWLLSVQLRAPGCPVIIVGTHLDAMPDASRVKDLEKIAMERYSKPNYPKVLSVLSVSCLYNKLNNAIEELRKMLYHVACHLSLTKAHLEYMPDMPESDPKALFQQHIPKTFLSLQEQIRVKVSELKAEGKSPIMEDAAFKSTFMHLFDDEDELAEAVYFLNLQGTLLHFDDHTLRDVYFLDPQWLAKLLADIFHPAAMETFKNGVAEISDLFNQRDTSTDMKAHYISLLEKFEVALKINNHQMIIPSLMSERADDIPSDISTSMLDEVEPPLRRFWLADFVPAGFWPRLICRVATDQQIGRVLHSVIGIGSPPNVSTIGSVHSSQHNVSSSESVNSNMHTVSPSESVNSNMHTVSPSESVNSNMHTVSPSESVNSNMHTVSPSESVNSNMHTVSPSESVNSNMHTVSPSESVNSNMHTVSPSESVNSNMDTSVDMPCKSPTPSQALDMSNNWTPWKTGMAFSYLGYTLMMITQSSNNLSKKFIMARQMKFPLLKSKQHIEVHIYINEWVALTNKLFGHGSDSHSISIDSIRGQATKLLVMVTNHVKKSGLSDMSTLVKTYMPCWKCYAEIEASRQESDGDKLHEGKNPGSVFVVEDHVVTAALGNTLKCYIHGDIKIMHMAPDLIFCDLSTSYQDSIDSLNICEDEVLGKGGFGFVCKGEIDGNRGAKKNVAVKIFLKDIAKHLDSATISELLEMSKQPEHLLFAYQEIRQEVSFLSNLDHQNLTKLCGVRTSPYMCLMLELAQKKSLRAILKEYTECALPLEPLTLKNTALQIGQGLEYLHSNQVVHLDMKSPNVLIWHFPSPRDSRQVRQSGKVWIKIADYGISQVSTGLTLRVDNKPRGTPGFMAPELFDRAGQVVSSDKVDVFAYGMVLFELLTQRSPFEYIDFQKRSFEVQEGRRPSIYDKDTRTPIFLQELMELCWDKDPQKRPTMTQAVEWIRANEFERLRAELDLEGMISISSSCVCRILPEHEPDMACFDSAQNLPLANIGDLSGVLAEFEKRRPSIHQMIPNIPTNTEYIQSSDGVEISNTEESVYQFILARRQSEEDKKRNALEQSFQRSFRRNFQRSFRYRSQTRVLSEQPRRTVQEKTAGIEQGNVKGGKEVDSQCRDITGKGRTVENDDIWKFLDPYTQIWLCGRGQRKGLLQILTYNDGYPGSYLFSGYCSQDDITSMCAVRNMMWMGTSAGAIKVFHAPTLKAKFTCTLISEGMDRSILSILYVEQTHTVLVAGVTGEVWVFDDTIVENGLKQQWKLGLDNSLCYHLIKVSINSGAKIEVWGTMENNRLLVLERRPHSTSWQHSELVVRPKDSKLNFFSHIAFTSFVDSSGLKVEHVWVSYRKSGMLLSFNARTKEQRTIINCTERMESYTTQSVRIHITTLMCTDRKVLVGTTVGMVTVFDSETTNLLNCFNWHKDKVRTLLAMPREVEPCVCAEVPFPDQEARSSDGHNTMNDQSVLITSVGNGKERFLVLHEEQERNSEQNIAKQQMGVVLLTWSA